LRAPGRAAPPAAAGSARPAAAKSRAAPGPQRAMRRTARKPRDLPGRSKAGAAAAMPGAGPADANSETHLSNLHGLAPMLTRPATANLRETEAAATCDGNSAAGPITACGSALNRQPAGHESASPAAISL